MSKVVTERPRDGHYLASRKTRLRIRRYDPEKDYDDLPLRVSGSRNKHLINAQKQSKRWYTEVKQFSDLIGPLQRFLRSNVGRPWDDVYSEMKQSLDSRKVTGQHIFDHVRWEVELHPVIGEDGKIYQRYPHYRERPLLQGLYVDPRTGLLCWSDTKPSWRQRGKSKTDAQEVNSVRLSANTGYVKMRGIWYCVEYKIFGWEKLIDYDQDEQTELLHKAPGISVWPILILRKKQLSHKELKAAKLKNDHPLAGKDEVNKW